MIVSALRRRRIHRRMMMMSVSTTRNAGAAAAAPRASARAHRRRRRIHRRRRRRHHAFARDRPPVAYGSVRYPGRRALTTSTRDPRPDSRVFFFSFASYVLTYCARKHPHERPRFGFRRPRTTARTPCRSESRPGLIFRARG
jgi:hypothetical protein